MTQRTNVRTIAACLFALTFFLPLGCNSSSGQGSGSTTSGALTMLPDYQARAPRTCSPVASPPSAATAAILVQCNMDALSATGLGLTQDVKLQIGKSRPFDNWSDLGLLNIDSTATVYPLQGSYTGYFCRLIGTAPTGQSCIKSVVPVAQGWCWKTSFGDWRCKLLGSAPKMENSPPPLTF